MSRIKELKKRLGKPEGVSKSWTAEGKKMIFDFVIGDEKIFWEARLEDGKWRLYVAARKQSSTDFLFNTVLKGWIGSVNLESGKEFWKGRGSEFITDLPDSDEAMETIYNFFMSCVKHMNNLSNDSKSEIETKGTDDKDIWNLNTDFFEIEEYLENLSFEDSMNISEDYKIKDLIDGINHARTITRDLIEECEDDDGLLMISAFDEDGDPYGDQKYYLNRAEEDSRSLPALILNILYQDGYLEAILPEFVFEYYENTRRNDIDYVYIPSMDHFEDEEEIQQEYANFYGEVISYMLKKVIMGIANEIEEEFGEEYARELKDYWDY